MANMKEVVYSLDSLPLLEVEDYGAAEKSVFHLTDSQREIAGKIYKVRAAKNARQELAAYRKLLETPLGLYVPEPYGLLSDSGRIVGLAVQWRTPLVLSDYLPARILPAQEFELLGIAVAEAAEDQVMICADMLEGYNIGLDAGSSPPIFFTECALLSLRTDKIRYQRVVNKQIDRLIREFAF